MEASQGVTNNPVEVTPDGAPHFHVELAWQNEHHLVLITLWN